MKTSPVVLQYLDDVYRKHRAKIDEKTEYLFEEGIQGKKFEKIFAENLLFYVDAEFAKYVEPYIRENFNANGLTELYDIEVTTIEKTGEIWLEAKTEGEWLEIPDDPMDAIEVPEFDATRSIESTLKASGAHSASAPWKIGNLGDPSWRQNYDAVHYYISAKWKTNASELAERYARGRSLVARAP
jgi:hypothetical protein